MVLCIKANSHYFFVIVAYFEEIIYLDVFNNPFYKWNLGLIQSRRARLNVVKFLQNRFLRVKLLLLPTS